MVSISCSSNIEYLQESASDFSVLLYGSPKESPSGYSIGNSCKRLITQLDLLPNQRAFDLLTIALSVIAADNFIPRKLYGSDGFARRIDLEVSIVNIETWNNVKIKLEETLNFLTGDQWSLSFVGNGERVPAKYEHKYIRKFNEIHTANSVCLFSGGLDSFIGSISQTRNHVPVLVSRSSTGDQKFQNTVAALFPALPRFVMNDYPVSPEGADSEISTRARSFLFLAMGAIICSSLSALRGKSIPLIVPENGFIALNPPLTKRRLGANSTRTAHPYYLSSLQSIFDSAGIPASIENPFRFLTKGEMFLEFIDEKLITHNADKTVSCGHWKRSRKQCGRCWPCLIRRSSFLKAGIEDSTLYQTQDLKTALGNKSEEKDLKAVLYAIHLFDKYGRKSPPIRSMRNLPIEKHVRSECLSVVERGFEELRDFLFDQGVWL